MSDRIPSPETDTMAPKKKCSVLDGETHCVDAPTEYRDDGQAIEKLTEERDAARANHLKVMAERDALAVALSKMDKIIEDYLNSKLEVARLGGAMQSDLDHLRLKLRLECPNCKQQIDAKVTT